MAPSASLRTLTIVRIPAQPNEVKAQKLQKETFASRIADISNVMVRWRGRHVRRHTIG